MFCFPWCGRGRTKAAPATTAEVEGYDVPTLPAQGRNADEAARSVKSVEAATLGTEPKPKKLGEGEVVEEGSDAGNGGVATPTITVTQPSETVPAFQPLASASSSTSPRVSNTPQTPQTAQDDKTEKTTENTQDDDKVQSTAQAMRTDSQTNGASAKKDVAGEENSKPAATTAAASTPAYPTGASGSPTLPELNISGQDELANLRSSICVTGKDSPQKGLAKEAKGKDETAESGPGATPGADGEPQVGQDKSDGKTATVTHEDTKPAINDTTKDTTAASPPVTTRDNLKDPNGITDLPANSSTSVKVIDTAEPTAAATPRYVIDLMDTSSDEEDPDGGAGGFVSSKDSAVRGCAGDMIFKSDPTNVAIGALQLEGVTEPNGKIKVEKESEAEGKA